MMYLWTLLRAVMSVQEGAIPKLLPQSWELKLSKMSQYAEALRVPFSRTKEPSPEKHPHTITPPPPTFTLGQTSTALLETFKLLQWTAR